MSEKRRRKEDGIPHGTVSGYASQAWRCRCRVCKSAYAAYRRERRALMRRDLEAGQMPTLIHGNASTYENFGCRCRPCTKAATRKVRERRAKAGTP